MKTVVLVDMDGVIVNIDDALESYVKTNFPDAKPNGSDAWKIEERYDGIDRKDLTPLFYSERFFLDLPILPGAEEGVAKLNELFEVRICTTPKTSLYCGGEKYVWIDRHFPYLRRKVTQTKDKTEVRGHYLIDDKPVIEGLWTPTWKHIRYHPDVFTWDKVDELIGAIKIDAGRRNDAYTGALLTPNEVRSL